MTFQALAHRPLEVRWAMTLVLRIVVQAWASDRQTGTYDVLEADVSRFTGNFRFADKPPGRNLDTAYRLGPNSRSTNSLSALISFSEITLKSAAAPTVSALVALVEVVIHLRRFSS